MGCLGIGGKRSEGPSTTSKPAARIDGKSPWAACLDIGLFKSSSVPASGVEACWNPRGSTRTALPGLCHCPSGDTSHSGTSHSSFPISKASWLKSMPSDSDPMSTRTSSMPSSGSGLVGSRHQSYRQEGTHESRHGSPTPGREGHHRAAAGSRRVLPLHLGDFHPIPVALQHEQPACNWHQLHDTARPLHL